MTCALVSGSSASWAARRMSFALRYIGFARLQSGDRLARRPSASASMAQIVGRRVVVVRLRLVQPFDRHPVTIPPQPSWPSNHRRFEWLLSWIHTGCTHCGQSPRCPLCEGLHSGAAVNGLIDRREPNPRDSPDPAEPVAAETIGSARRELAMSDQEENIELVKKGYESFTAGDGATVRGRFDDDIGGSNRAIARSAVLRGNAELRLPRHVGRKSTTVKSIASLPTATFVASGSVGIETLMRSTLSLMASARHYASIHTHTPIAGVRQTAARVKASRTSRPCARTDGSQLNSS